MPRLIVECSANPDAAIEIDPAGAFHHDTLHAIIASRQKGTKT